MFAPFDQGNHGGMLTGDPSNRRAYALRGLAGATASFDFDVAEYMLHGFKPPAADASPGEKLLYAKALQVAAASPNVKKYLDLCVSEGQYRIASQDVNGACAAAQLVATKAVERVDVAKAQYEKTLVAYQQATASFQEVLSDFVDWVHEPFGGAFPKFQSLPLVEAAVFVKPEDYEFYWKNREDKKKSMLGKIGGGNVNIAPGEAQKLKPLTEDGTWNTRELVFPWSNQYPAQSKGPSGERTAGVVSSTLPGAFYPHKEPTWQRAITDSSTYQKWGSSSSDGWMVSWAWNNKVWPKAKALSQCFTLWLTSKQAIVDMQQELVSAQKNLASLQAQKDQLDAVLPQFTEARNAALSKLKDFNRGYAGAIGKQILAASDLAGMTQARQKMDAQLDAWAKQIDSLNAQVADLLKQAENTTDPQAKAALELRAGRLGGRAASLNTRRGDVIGLRGGLSKDRAGKIEEVASTQQQTGTKLDAVSQAQFDQNVKDKAELDAKLAEQKRINEEQAQQIKDLLKKISSENLPPNIDPDKLVDKQNDEAKGGGLLGLLALAAAGFALTRK